MLIISSSSPVQGLSLLRTLALWYRLFTLCLKLVLCTSLGLRANSRTLYFRASVLQCLKERFKRRVVYTSAGATLVAVNPFRHIPGLYGDEVIRRLHDAHAHAQQEAAAHVYGVAEEAWRRLQRDGPGTPGAQSVIVSGESGAGKVRYTP